MNALAYKFFVVGLLLTLVGCAALSPQVREQKELERDYLTERLIEEDDPVVKEQLTARLLQLETELATGYESRLDWAKITGVAGLLLGNFGITLGAILKIIWALRGSPMERKGLPPAVKET